MVVEKAPINDPPKELVLPLEFPNHVEAARHYFQWNDEVKDQNRELQLKAPKNTDKASSILNQLQLVGRSIQLIVDGVKGNVFDPVLLKYLKRLGYEHADDISIYDKEGMMVGINPNKVDDSIKIWLADAYQNLLRGKMIGEMSTLKMVEEMERMKEIDEIYFAQLSHRYGERLHILRAFRSRMMANLPRINENKDTLRNQWLKMRGGEPIILYRGQSLPQKDQKSYRHTLTAVGLRKGGLNYDEVELMSNELMKREGSIDWATLALGHSSRATISNREMVDPLLSCSASDLKAKQYGEVIRLKVPPEYVVPMAYIAERKVREIELQMRNYTTKPDHEDNRRLSAARGKWLQYLNSDEEYMVIGYVRSEWVIDADVREIMEGADS